MSDSAASAAGAGAGAGGEIDEDLYSRQLYVLGHDAMSRMQKADVLLVGLRGLGVEIAKNVILQGVKSVTLWDNGAATLDDLSAQFYLSKEDLGKPRAASCAAKLAELNNYVPVRVESRESIEDADFLSQFAVVVCTDFPLADQLKVNALCREKGVAFISTETHGVYASAFCDFGEKFVVTDTNGEAAHTQIVTGVTRSNPALITVVDDQLFPLENGQLVTFSDVGGIPQLNDAKEPFKIANVSKYQFELEGVDSTDWPAFTTGGTVTEVKPPATISFASLAESLVKPEHVIVDFAKFLEPAYTHIAFQALAKFGDTPPRPHNAEDAAKVVALAREINDALGDDDTAKVDFNADVEAHIRRVAFQARGQLANVIASVGGLVAQEVQKACSGKFMPLRQYWYFDAVESLPDGYDDMDEAQFAGRGDRYDAQVAAIGLDLHDKITKLNYFLVGSGAIGCEVLKIWAMMGLASQGHITVTDMDVIEKSNLNRQFLFRPKDVGSLKSETAANAVQVMNPDLAGKVTAMSTRVGPETEDTFSPAFFAKLDGVCNALDNVQARLYMDGQCVFHGKTLLESGTLGTKGNTQVVIPHVTESYGSSRDPPEKSIPMCTLHHFPNNITHTIQWGRDVFEGLFVGQMESANAFLASASDFTKSLAAQSLGSRLEALRSVKSALVDDKPSNWADCVAWGRLKFEEYFNNNIQQLLYNFPKDMVNKETGVPFWTAPKVAPDALTFDEKDPEHVLFVQAAANLRAFCYGIKGSRDPADVIKHVGDVEIPKFVPRGGMKIDEGKDEADAGAGADDGLADKDEDEAKELDAALTSADFSGISKLTPVDFEKDDDSNWHMDFIKAAANLRAINYSIEPTDKHTAKGIAGKIIPAMVTTTSVVSGLVCIELTKLIQRADPKAGDDAPGKRIGTLTTMGSFKSAFVNLAINSYQFAEPIAAARSTVREGWTWTLWDTIKVEGKGKELTLQEFIDYFESELKLEVSMISSGTALLYSSFMAADKRKDRLPAKLSEVIKTVTKKDLPPGDWVQLEVIVELIDAPEGTEDDDVDIPTVLYRHSGY